MFAALFQICCHTNYVYRKGFADHTVVWVLTQPMTVSSQHITCAGGSLAAFHAVNWRAE